MFKYFAQIDGLRAISVILVILYHYEIPFFDFGYLGVDIFFVISGFLITGLLLDGKNLKKNKINFFISFISRRFLRLFPNLLIVVILSYIGSIALIPSDNFKDFAQSAGSSLFFASNFLFFLEEGYFDQSSNLKPLLHTWSLSIEFQFYILFSFFSIFIFKLNKKIIFLINILIIFLSVFYLFNFNISRDLFFYLTQFRIWEILVGSTSFFILNKFNEKYKYSVYPIFIIVFLLFTAVLSLKVYNYFNVSLLLFVLLTFVFLIFLNNHYIANFFSKPKLVYVGKISYGLYLFHYPIYVFCNYYFLNNVNFFTKLSCFFLSLILSAISYSLIEKNIKNQSRIYKINFSRSLVSLAFLISFFSIYIHFNKDLYFRYKTPYFFKKFEITENIELVKKFNRNPYLSLDDNGKNCHNDKFDNKSCNINFGKSKKIFLLIGDSYAGNYSNAYNTWLKKNNYSGEQYTVGGCDLISTVERCQEFRDYLFKLLNSKKFETIIFSIQWKNNNDILNNKEYMKNLKKIIEILQKSSSNLFIFSPRMESAFSFQSFMLSPKLNSQIIMPDINKHINNFSIIYNYFLNKKLENKSKFIDTNKLLCDVNNCNIINDNIIFYKDKYHYTNDGAEFIFKKIFN